MKHKSVVEYIEGFSPYHGWDPILGQQVTVVMVPIVPEFARRDIHDDGKFRNQKQATHFNAKQRKTFTRSIGYA